MIERERERERERAREKSRWKQERTSLTVGMSSSSTKRRKSNNGGAFPVPLAVIREVPSDTQEVRNPVVSRAFAYGARTSGTAPVPSTSVAAKKTLKILEKGKAMPVNTVWQLEV